jgi:hypothetical protein
MMRLHFILLAIASEKIVSSRPQAKAYRLEKIDEIVKETVLSC